MLDVPLGMKAIQYMELEQPLYVLSARRENTTMLLFFMRMSWTYFAMIVNLENINLILGKVRAWSVMQT